MLEFKTIHNRDEWDRALVTLPSAHVLQSWDWGDFKRRWGWTAERLLWTETGTAVAAAQILGRSIPFTPWNFLYVSKGPALDYANTGLVETVLANLEAFARTRRALFMKIDPDVPRQYGEPGANQPPQANGQAVIDILRRRCWRFSSEQIQFRNTVVINLIPDPEDLLAAMKSKWRYNIRLAERKGVTMRAGTVKDVSTFYQLYADTAARDGFLIRPEAYYRDVWQRFLEMGVAEMLLASVKDNIIAGLILFVFGQTAWYLYGASARQYRQFMPNHLVQWTAILRAKERGCTCYDMWGAPDVFDEADRMWGVYRFKRGFGGEVVQGLGAFDYPVNRPLYWAFASGMPPARSLLRRLKVLLRSEIYPTGT